MQSKQLTKSQKIILAVGGGIILAFFIVWLAVLMPAKGRVHALKMQVDDVNQQIKDIEDSVGKTKGLAEGLRSLDIKAKSFENKFSSDINETLRTLYYLAEESHLKIDFVKPSIKKSLLDEQGKNMTLDSKTCAVIYVNLLMKGTFRDLIKFRELLEDKLPGFLSIETLEITRQDPKLPDQITIYFGFNLYFLD